MAEVPQTPDNDNDNGVLAALGFLTGTYDTELTNGTGVQAMSGLIGGVLEDAMASTDDPAQKLLNGITALTDVLGGMTVLARALLDKCAELMAVEPAEILEGFGKQLNHPQDNDHDRDHDPSRTGDKH